MERLDEHTKTIKAAFPKLSYKPIEYVTGRCCFPSLRDPRGRYADQFCHRSGRRVRADLRVGLSVWREPLSRAGLAGAGLGDGPRAQRKLLGTMPSGSSVMMPGDTRQDRFERRVRSAALRRCSAIYRTHKSGLSAGQKISRLSSWNGMPRGRSVSAPRQSVQLIITGLAGVVPSE